MKQPAKNIALYGLLIAMIALATAVIRFPVLVLPSAYIHAGDGIILLAGWLLGGVAGAVLGGIGSAIADVAVGAAVYALPTLIIKAAMGLLAGLLLHRSGKPLTRLLLMLPAVLTAPVGYFLFEAVLYGAGPALLSIPFNLLQSAGGIVIGAALISGLEKSPSIAALARRHAKG